MDYPKIPLAQHILQACLAEGITDIVISPGSRNAPLTIGFASNPDFNCYSIADERCAAFFATGMAQQLKKPVALLCTSGSALLNYYPAFAEAFYSEIPLVVLSADRPADKIDIGDGQTIRQANVYANHSLYNANLSEHVSPENDRLILEAMRTAKHQKGPVHINIPFEEPLYETVPELTSKLAFFPESETIQEKQDFNAFVAAWNSAPKKMILTGVNDPGVLSQDLVDFMGEEDSVLVLTETTSNLHHPNFIAHIDTLITPFSEEDFLQLQPDLLLTFGGMVVSKRIKTFLRKYKPKQHWHIDVLRAYDTFGALTEHIKSTPQSFFSFIKEQNTVNRSDYAPSIRHIFDYRTNRHWHYLSEAPFSDLKAYERILEALPSDSMLQISNSAAIRYAQLVPFYDSISVYCNRGTSGIDGSTSTAIGAAVASSKQTVLLTGDIGFFYDSNALWNQYIPDNFRIILVNNGGGGIFRILPGHRENKVFNRFFETSHHYNASHLAAMYHFDYYTANDEQELGEALRCLFSDGGKPAILEVFTPEKLNDKILTDYFKALA